MLQDAGDGLQNKTRAGGVRARDSGLCEWMSSGTGRRLKKHFAVAAIRFRDALRRLRLWTALVVSLLPPALHANQGADFYHSAFARGRAAYRAGSNVEALRLLRIAAFGLINDARAYQVVSIYALLAADRLGDTKSADSTFAKIMEAEKIAGALSSVDLGPDRTAFEALLKKRGVTLPAPPAAPAVSIAATHDATAAGGVPAGGAHAAEPGPAAPALATPSPAATDGGSIAVAARPAKEPANGRLPAVRDWDRPPPASYVLQIAIACESATIAKLRSRLEEVSLESIPIRSRTCHKVFHGSFPTIEAAAAAAAGVQRRAKTPDPPAVVRRTAP